MLTANINIIPGYILNMTLKPSSELTFRENIDNVIAEFRTDRNLMVNSLNLGRYLSNLPL